MSTESDLRATIVAAGVDRVYPRALPADVTLPAATYQRISTRPNRSHNGTNMLWVRFQITVWSNSAHEAESVARLVSAAFHPLVGQALVENDYAVEDPDQRLHGRAVDVVVRATVASDTADVSS